MMIMLFFMIKKPNCKMKKIIPSYYGKKNKVYCTF